MTRSDPSSSDATTAPPSLPRRGRVVLTPAVVARVHALKRRGNSESEINSALRSEGIRLSKGSISNALKFADPASPKLAPPKPTLAEAPKLVDDGPAPCREVTSTVRGPRGFVAPVRNAAWHVRREELLERGDAAATCDEANADRLALAVHETPELGAWMRDGDDVVSALLDADLGDVLLLVSTPAAFASLARWVSEAPYDATAADTRAAACALLADALDIVSAPVARPGRPAVTREEHAALEADAARVLSPALRRRAK